MRDAALLRSCERADRRTLRLRYSHLELAPARSESLHQWWAISGNRMTHSRVSVIPWRAKLDRLPEVLRGRSIASRGASLLVRTPTARRASVSSSFSGLESGSGTSPSKSGAHANRGAPWSIFRLPPTPRTHPSSGPNVWPIAAAPRARSWVRSAASARVSPGWGRRSKRAAIRCSSALTPRPARRGGGAPRQAAARPASLWSPWRLRGYLRGYLSNVHPGCIEPASIVLDSSATP